MKNCDRLIEIVSNEELNMGTLEERELWIRASVALQFVKMREEMGLTQSDVAKKMGVSFQQISKFEGLVNSPTLMFLTKYAKALDTTFDVLLRDVNYYNESEII